MLQMSVLNVSSVFQTYVASVFIWMLQMFYLDACVHVAMVFKYFMCFLQVFQMHVSNVLFVFGRMLQLLHLNVLKLVRVLHLPPRLSIISPWCQVREGRGGLHWRRAGPRACGRRSRQDVGGQAQDVRRGAAARALGRGLASGHSGASHGLK